MRQENRELTKKLNDKRKAYSYNESTTKKSPRDRRTNIPNGTRRKGNPNTFILNPESNHPGSVNFILTSSGRNKKNTPPHKRQPGIHYKDNRRNLFPREHPTFLCARYTPKNG